ncbi:formimidoylglutamate deiminase [Paeniglutamicibacter cryotolerans]|uniref:Formiminoglutamate deiminase n=1 Tax=Paeniglutamicibacter cryotolerans TaxID=670079 RepID=A0A839QQ10_9MICC|nr:formimidoylglutamate deiminase [Paeniglutamicibacter cryotolerans]MBB2996076.1 formiminoglutamate deiminase [Paeniglutamicibacter cryotolerans]
MSTENLVTVPGPVNAHSHAFHRILRGRTHEGADGGAGTFWTWRDQMYAAAAGLTPAGYQQLATATFAEMAVTGWTAVGEFHYLHHDVDGTPYGAAGTGETHAMERALARAAKAAGIRLVLLDTCYLQGGLGADGAALELNETQVRFSDGDVAGWLARHDSLAAALAQEDAGEGLVSLGAAIHSVRAVSPEALAQIAAGLDPTLPLHVHLSEQPAENEACLAAYGLSPTGLLERAGLLGARLSAVHATHLSEADIAALGAAGAGIVMCPTTEADLGDGIGPARELADAGAVISLGTDQHAVVDPYLEQRALEHGERLRSGVRGRFSPTEIAAAARAGGLRSLGLAENEDHLVVRADTMRTIGSRAAQLPLTATAADIAEVHINGVLVAKDGIHTTLGDPAALFAAFLAEHGEFS